MIYLDSSALMKLVRTEVETAPLLDWLDRHPLPWVTSELGRVEVIRAACRAGAAAAAEARALTAGLDLVALGRDVQNLACEVGGPLLRTLDALHLASAVMLGDALTAFIAYDHRLADAASELGLPVVVPT